MSNFNTSNWFVNREKYNFQEFTVEGVDFNLIPLTDELIMEVKNQGTLEATLHLAAEYGMSVGRDRIVDNEVQAADISVFWALPEINIGDPLIKNQVGLKVCEISGLDEHLQVVREVEDEAELAALEAKENQSAIDGDNLPSDGVTMGQLEDDANTYAVNNNL